LTIDALVGTYTLTAFTVTFDDGTIITEEDVSSFSGTMVIRPDYTLTQTIEVNGSGGTFPATINSIGKASINVTSGGCTYNLGVTLKNNVLTTTFIMGTCGTDYSEVDVWTKTSSSPSAATEADNIVIQTDENEEIVLGGAGGKIYDLLP
jgi:hypothetical protein